MTNTDRLMTALKILNIETSPTDTMGVLTWYTQGGEYLGSYTTEEGLAFLRDTMEMIKSKEDNNE